MREITRILHVFPYYCAPEGTDSGGGTKTALLTILQGLDHGRYDSLVLLPAPSHQYDPPFLAAGARELVYLNDPTHLVIEFTRLRSFHYLPEYMARLTRNVIRIRKVIYKSRIDLVHSHVSSFVGAAIAAKSCGVPCIIHVHEYPYRFSPWMRRAYQRVVPLLGNYILCCSDFVRQGFIRAGCPVERMRTVHNAVDLTAFRPDGNAILHSELGMSNDHLIIGLVGRLTPRKGVEYFLEAAMMIVSQRNDVVFVVVGDNDLPAEQNYKQSLFAMAERAELKGKVHFLGARADMVNIYNSMDVLIISSTQDAGPYAPLEAMAMAVPVVSASEGGAMEEVEDGVTGIHVRPRDAEGIAQAVLKLLADPDRLRQMGRAARLRVERLFSQQRYVQEVTEVYEELLGQYGKKVC